MKNMLSLSCVLVVSIFGIPSINAQAPAGSSHSTSVSVPPTQMGSRQFRGTNDSTPNSISAEMKRWESILSQSYPGRFQGSRKTGVLLRELRQMGLPILLHQSAKDDLLDRDQVIELKLPNASLHTRLLQVLEEFNACLTFANGRILVISLDDADSYEYHITITYDISGMGLAPIQMIDTVQNSIMVDSWEDTGTGLATISYIPMRGQDLVVIGQTYNGHLAVRQLLNDINRLTGSRVVRNHHRGFVPVTDPRVQSSGTRVVPVPGGQTIPPINSRRFRPRPAPAALGASGGGVFSIRD